jgi:hypothetical protein
VIENFQSAVKLRLLIALTVIHSGLVVGIFALARESFSNGWDVTSTLFLVSICALYGGLVLAVLFVVLPLLPWLRRAQRVDHWTERLIRDLPILVEQLPKLLLVIQSIVAVWSEARAQKPASPSVSGSPNV